jgi:hypothetical protein
MELREILKKAVWDGMDDRCVEPCWAATNTDTIRGCGCVGNAADAILSALDKAGLVVVPREPTEEMTSLGWDQALREAYAAGLERAAEIADEAIIIAVEVHGNFPKGAACSELAAAIRAEKEVG